MSLIICLTLSGSELSTGPGAVVDLGGGVLVEPALLLAMAAGVVVALLGLLVWLSQSRGQTWLVLNNWRARRRLYRSLAMALAAGLAFLVAALYSLSRHSGG